jgi:hypothetical protein
MQALQSHDLLSSDTQAMDQLQAFLRQRRAALGAAYGEGTPSTRSQG